MNFDSIHNVYFLGIGGIGMSALARYFYACGKQVAGYDLNRSKLTEELENSGISIHYSDDVNQIPQICKNVNNTLVVLTPAVPKQHNELNWFREHKFEIKKRAEVLGVIFNARKGIAISGTHGKTSVSSMTAFILSKSEQGCSAFLGGILKNTESNLILNEKSNWLVAEADEFDRSFLQLYPLIALVTWVDTDHLDIYASHQEIQQAFEKFISQVDKEGVVILKKGIQLSFDAGKRKILSYSLDDTTADYYALNLRLANGRYTFDIQTPKGVIQNILLPYPGIINIENAVAAASAAIESGVDKKIVGVALSEFQGVQRRFDIHVENGHTVYIDDYAHHPRELDAIIGSIRKMFPNRKITGVFQPHLFSRTRDFADDFAESLSALDELILLEIYPAREKPIPGVSSSIIFDKVKSAKKTLCNKSNLIHQLSLSRPEVLVTMGAGDIDRYIGDIKKMAETW